MVHNIIHPYCTKHPHSLCYPVPSYHYPFLPYPTFIWCFPNFLLVPLDIIIIVISFMFLFLRTTCFYDQSKILWQNNKLNYDKTTVMKILPSSFSDRLGSSLCFFNCPAILLALDKKQVMTSEIIYIQSNVHVESFINCFLTWPSSILLQNHPMKHEEGIHCIYILIKFLFFLFSFHIFFLLFPPLLF